VVHISTTLVQYLIDWKIYQHPSIELDFEYCQHVVEFTKQFFEKLINDFKFKTKEMFT